MLRPTLTILFSSLAFAAGVGCSTSPSGTSGSGSNATPASCPAPGPNFQLTLSKKDGNCESDLYSRTMALPNDTCVVTQAPPGSCSATFKCSSKKAEGTEDYAGDINLTATGAGKGKGTVSIANADGSPKCKGNYDVEIAAP